jgi:hypothetical protein
LRFPFTDIPEPAGGPPRPAVPVVVDGLVRAPQLGLLDTGSLHNRFGSWIAGWCGIDLTDAGEEVIALGGFRTVARTVPVQLAVGDFVWEAPVSFCDPWPLGFQLLGQEGFFRWFKVEIRAAQFTIDVEPEDR